jgi:hypothetical protein
VNYSPYDLVPLTINGKSITGRPFQFDSDVVNQMTMTNAFGVVVKPSRVITTCPDCGQGFELDVKLGDPPFQAVVVACPVCKPAPPPVQDPFLNPIKTGRIQAFELDPILHDPKQPLAEKVGTVADRFAMPESPVLPSPVPSVAPTAPAARPPRGKKPKKDKKKPQAITPPAPAPAPVADTTAPKVMTQQVVPPRIEEQQSPDDPFTLTKMVPTRLVEVEKADGLGEEQDFDDKDMVE